MTNAAHRRLASVERVPTCLNGRPTTRLVVIFRASGCAWARKPGGGCAMCGFQAMTTAGKPVEPADLIAQFESVVAQPGAFDGVGEVHLYNSGSFFADQEFPPEVREHVLGRLGRAEVQRVLVESRPEYLRAQQLVTARAALGTVELEVGMGLESADDRIREVLICKGFGRSEFERAVGTLGESASRLLIYLLIKPPGLTEEQALQDAVASARYAFDVARSDGVPARVAFQPVFVAPGTALGREYLAGRYRPPSLWTVIDVLRQTHPLGEVSVGLSEEGLGAHAIPAACALCTPRLKAALTEYNRTRALPALDQIPCDCQLATRHPKPAEPQP